MFICAVSAANLSGFFWGGVINNYGIKINSVVAFVGMIIANGLFVVKHDWTIFLVMFCMVLQAVELYGLCS
eukprot:UN03430